MKRLPECEAPGERCPLREPLAVGNGGGAVLHYLEQRLGDLGQGGQGESLSVGGGEGEGAVRPAAAAAAGPPLARRPRRRAEGGGRRRLHLGDSEELVEFWQGELVQTEAQESLALVWKGMEKIYSSHRQRRGDRGQLGSGHLRGRSHEAERRGGHRSFSSFLTYLARWALSTCRVNVSC